MTTPIRWQATAVTQYCQLRLSRVRIRSPFFRPRELRKFAACLERSEISRKVNVRRSPRSLSQTRARFSGSASAQASTTSRAKLKCSGTCSS